jgi:chromosome segregation protein
LLNELKRKTGSIREDISRNENRVRSLEEIILSHEEYDNATRQFLDFMSESPDKAEELGFLGSLVELSVLPEKIPATAAAFLNRYFNLLVFRSVSKLKEIIQLAEEQGFEQFQMAFLDLKQQAGSQAKNSLNSLISIQSDSSASLPFIDLFETLDAPVHSLSKSVLSKSDGLIDSDSTVMTRGGIFLVGKPGSSNLAETLINRRNEITSLNKETSTLKKQLITLEDQLQEGSDTVDEFARLLSSTRQDLVELDLELVSLEKEFDNKSQEKQRIEKARENMSNEQIQLIQHRTQFEEKIKSLSNAITENEQKCETIRKVCDGLQKQIEKTESSQEESSGELQHLKVVLAGLKEKQQNNSSSLQRLNGDIADREKQKSDIVQRSQQTDNKRKAAHSSLQEAESRLPLLLEQLKEMEQKQNAMSDHIESGRTQQMELANSIKKEHQSSTSLMDKDHKLEIKLSQLLQEARNIEDNLFAEDSLKPEDLIQTFNVKTFSIDKEAETIAELKKKIGGMEDINLAAKTEYDALKERLDFLDTQSSDLTKSMEALESSIAKINQESRKRFKTTFALINEKFSKLFPQLFGGGEAYLKLTNEADLLESGVDIIVQPPGKKLQNMTLLSGGEKALTAIALIFAVFMIKPSPFCLLDEVDAPLDDANNIRFNKHVQTMTSNSQFIIITHNKKTMEIGNALFGITMEEPGISKIVSVDFNSIDSDSLQNAI